MPLAASFDLASGREAPEMLKEQNLRWSSSFFLYMDEKDYTFYLPDALVDHPQDPDKRISFQFSGGNDGFNLNMDSLLFNQYKAQGVMSLQSDRERGVKFSASADVQDIPYEIHGSYGNGQLVLRGEYIDTFIVDLRNNIRFYVKAKDFPVPLPDKVSYFDLTSRGNFRDFEHWTFRTEDFTLRNLPFTRSEDSLHLSFVANSNRINLYRIEYGDDTSTIQGNGYFAMDRFRTADFFTIQGDGWLQLFSGDSEEHYQMILSLQDDQIESDISFRNAPLRRFENIPLRGDFSGDITLTGARKRPDIFVRFELEDGELNQDPFTFVSVFSLESDRMEIRELELDYLGINIQQGRGKYLFQEGAADFTAELRLPFQEEILRSTLELTMDTAEILKRSRLNEFLLNPFDGRLSVKDIQLGSEEKDPWDIGFGYDGELFAFYGGPGNSVSGTINQNREFSLALSDPFPLQLRLSGILKEGDIEAELEQIRLEVEPLQGGLRFPFFYLKSGVVSGQNIKVSGPMNDPDFNGLLSARNISAESPVIPEAIGPFDGQLALEEKTLSIDNLSFAVGTGNVSADLSFVLEHWLPATYDIRIRTGLNRGVHVKTDIGQLKLDGYALGNFNIIGDRSGTELSGRLTLSSAVLTLTSEKLPPPPSPSPHSLRTDFTFVTGRSVEFLWPSANLPILRSFAKTGQEMTVQYDSGNETLAVKGNIEIQGGIILYFQRNFFIKEGAVQFNENELKFDPLLSARAELREIDEEGESVQIFLVLDERPFSQFSPRFESIPSKTDAEIAALLGYSIFGGSTGEPITPSDALIQTSDLLLGQLGIVRSFEQSMKEIFSLDLFSIRTQILQNILLDRMVVEEQASQQGAATSNQLGRYLDNTTLFLGKYFGDNVFLEAMLQVQSNEQFFSTYSGEDVYSLETEISLEWKTPFFLLDIGVYPDFRDIVSSITTAKVGLSWSLSF
ncbi:translocation/assembly module TamB domain-containing protein [Marispirochaeta sp.]|uniref:translocation/assembly module TamB domain-containing protein n=1 Tax=Marispirochaeta sp. TaxID=2038653 RepID=UPI0029C8AA99|nr:translocation/assembly module TamB domain-containing protein [Marispirochaeta sp.]